MVRAGGHRRSVRLPGYDYRTSGAYFVTICTHRRLLLFEQPELAEIAKAAWERSAELRAEVGLDTFVVMPNHVHGVVWLDDRSEEDAGACVGAQRAAPFRRSSSGVERRSLSAFVRGYKSAVTREANVVRAAPGRPVWQRGFYEHVIRNEAGLDRVRRYIAENPRRWEFDRENPRGRPDAAEREFWEGLG